MRDVSLRQVLFEPTKYKRDICRSEAQIPSWQSRAFLGQLSFCAPGERETPSARILTLEVPKSLHERAIKATRVAGETGLLVITYDLEELKGRGVGGIQTFDGTLHDIAVK